MPLKALLNGDSFFSCELNESHRSLEFKCPICNDDFIPVIPQENIIKHFRHKNNRFHGEPETLEHISGKERICKELENLNWDYDPEHFLVGPYGDEYVIDVYGTKGDVKLGFEVQCSNITESRLKNKNMAYIALNILPIWIFGSDYYKNTNKFREHVNRDNLYQIQRIKKIEKVVLSSPYELYYFGGTSFYVGRFKERWNAEYLGWYSLHGIKFKKIVEENSILWIREFNPDSFLEKFMEVS